MCRPALRELKRINPRCKITFYTSIPQLLDQLTYIDKVVVGAPPKRARFINYEGAPRTEEHLAKVMGRSLGVTVRDVKPDVSVKHQLVQDWRMKLAARPHPWILIQMSASGFTPNKEWPQPNWRQLLDRVANRGATPILIGPPGVNSDDARFVDLRDRTTIDDLVALAASADAIVGPVSGPMHIAAAVGKPAVAIVGGYESPSNTLYETTTALGTDIECAPCWLDTPCPIDRRCLSGITVDMVETALWSRVGKLRTFDAAAFQAADAAALR